MGVPPAKSEVLRGPGCAGPMGEARGHSNTYWSPGNTAGHCPAHPRGSFPWGCSWVSIWGQVLEGGQRCRVTTFVGPPPRVTEDRRAQDSPTPTSARDRFLSNPMGSGSDLSKGRAPPPPTPTPGHLQEPPSARAHKGENPFLFHSLGQNGRHLVLAREARRALRTNQ